MVTATLALDGYAVVPFDPAVAVWAAAAHDVALQVLEGNGERRHGETWFVGVDALPNDPDGSIDGIPLAGAWLEFVTPPDKWHAAQLSVIFPGYPQQDAEESDAAHRFRKNRDAAHVDGLLPVGREKRRYLLEPHGFIAGFALNEISASPLVVWPGSHHIMRAAFEDAFAGLNPAVWSDVDVTEVYQLARRCAFDTCPRVEVPSYPGQAVLLHRHVLHGVAPWHSMDAEAGRMMAYFRPIVPMDRWLDGSVLC